MNNMLGRAIAIASMAFQDVTDKGGHPYIMHCLRVMNAMPTNDPELQCVAVLHDLIEDTSWTIQGLATEGFSNRVLSALILLTHDKNVDYGDYVKALASNPDARAVKLADLRDNSDITRMKGLGKKDFDRLEKYHRWFMYLSRL